MYKKVFDSVINDITSLGSAVFYGFMILLFYLLNRQEVALSLLLGIIFTCTTIILMKLIHFKPRPKETGYKNLFEKIKNGTFPSHHAANAGLLTIILGWYIPGLAMLLFLGIISAGIMASRVYLKKHYLNDTIAGYLVGLLVGLLIL